MATAPPPARQRFNPPPLQAITLRMKIGAIADDFTGASDLGLVLASGGLRCLLFNGPPRTHGHDADAGIVALRTRTAPVQEAVRRSLAALEWLQAEGCTQIYFKYCSTFDSTPEGNIGPVIAALVQATGTTVPVIVCPAFPANGRTVYQGHLFVGDRLLSESGMQDHPLTPMTDPDLRRVLAGQLCTGVGHAPLAAVRSDAATALRNAGHQIVVVDAIEDDDLRRLGRAAAGFPLVTGGSGLALGLPETLGARPGPIAFDPVAGAALCLAGSCSAATRSQIARHQSEGHPARRISPAEMLEGDLEALLAEALAAPGLPLLYTSGASDEVAGAQAAQARADIDMAAIAADQTDARAIHVLAGRGAGDRVQFLDLLAYALAATDRIVLIEPISWAAMSDYWLHDLDQAAGIVEEVGRPRLKILFDVWHVAMQHGDVSARHAAVAPLIGHVQIASVPDRAEPVGGELDVAALLAEMGGRGALGPVGCEYKPSRDRGFDWLPTLRKRVAEARAGR